MEKQLIISIGREYGSGGYQIGKKLAEKLGFEFLDRNLLEEVASSKGVDTNELSKYDEVPKKIFFSRTVRGMSNSPEQNVAEMQFALLKSKAADGDSFVVVGRCADELFDGICDDIVSIFICAEEKDKIKEITEIFKVSEHEAKKKMVRHDKKRRAYHDYFCKKPWGQVNTYDLCINSSVLGIDGTVDLIFDYVQHLLKK